MWVCPKCGRSFKNTNQDHYCGKPPATIEEYIAAQPEEAQDYLRQVNATIKTSIPDAKEKISWSIAGQSFHRSGCGETCIYLITPGPGCKRPGGNFFLRPARSHIFLVFPGKL